MQNEILSNFFCPLNSKFAAEVKPYLQKFMSDDDLDKALRLAVIMHFNCAGAVPVTEDGSQPDPQRDGQCALYLRMCKAAHSCSPNAFWYTVNSLGAKEMRSIQPIQSGSEVFISYLSDQQLLLPTAERRRYLQELKEFCCSCRRCVHDIEETRIFRCVQSGCEGTCNISGQHVTHCRKCQLAPTCAQTQRMLAEELVSGFSTLLMMSLTMASKLT